MKRKVQIALWVYVAGVLLCETASLWAAYENGGFQRHHTAAELALIVAIYVGTALLWPIIIIVVILQLIGVLPQPITF